MGRTFDLRPSSVFCFSVPPPAGKLLFSDFCILYSIFGRYYTQKRQKNKQNLFSLALPDSILI